MKAEDVDSALVHASERLRASMEQQVDVDGAFNRLRDSIRARTTPATAVPETGKSRDRTGEELMQQLTPHAGDQVSVATARPGLADLNNPHGMQEHGAREDAVIRMRYEEHASSLLTFALRLTGGDRQRAQDVVQETLIRAWRDAYRLSRPGRLLRPWLMTVTRQIANRDHEHPDILPTAPDDPVLGTFPALPDDTDGAVTNALRELRPSDREILIETYFRGRTVAEAAAKLDLPLDTAKSRTYLALRALRTALEQRHH
jgi:RNA polymerase sigma-70 factor, ECF subfamily